MSYYTTRQNRLLSVISDPIPCLLVPSAHHYLQLLSYHQTQANYVQKPKAEQEAACLDCPNKIHDNAALGKNMTMNRQIRVINFSSRQTCCWLGKDMAVPCESGILAFGCSCDGRG